MIAVEIEASLDSSDEGFIGMLFQFQISENLIHDPNRFSQLPARLGEDDPVIHEAEIFDPRKIFQSPIQRRKVECSHQGRSPV